MIRSLVSSTSKTRSAKVFNLVRGLQKEIDDDPNAAPILQALKDRAERILKDLRRILPPRNRLAAFARDPV
jgi:hypothetical protein